MNTRPAQTQTLPLSPSHLVDPGHTLIELLVALSLLVATAALSVMPFARVVASAEARGAAEVVQAALAEAQIETLAFGGRQVVAVTEGAWGLSRSGGVATTPRTVSSDELPHVSVATNVTRWTVGPGVAVAFGGWLAAPDSAGSIYLGEGVGGSRVVVRAETGLTRRERR